MSESKEKSKPRINSKRKGNNFEGSIVKILSETLQPLKFRRSQSSGAILGGSNKKFLDSYSDEAKSLFVGDVVPTNESDVIRDLGWKLKFTIEAKFYKSPDNFNHLFNNTKIKGWFDQACNDAEKIKKEPILIFKFNHCDTFCGVRSDTIGSLPSTLSRTMQICFEDQVKVTFFKFEEAIKDIEWWKQKNI